jgi:hypothetical protein
MDPAGQTGLSIRGQEQARRLRQVAFALLLLGVLWRCARYLLAFPIWCDEAFVLNNYPSRGYLDLLGPIDGCQIAPLLFHVAELAAFSWLGPGELSVRLPAFLAGVASLFLFWRLARLTLPPAGHTLAVGVLAVSVWPVSLAPQVKPYAFDLFFSLALLVPAASWLRDPSRLTPLLALALVAPVAVTASYPAALVGGAVGLALLPLAWRQRRAQGPFALYGVLLVGSFAAHYLLVGRQHLASPLPGATTAVGMDRHWDGAFPPADPARFVAWWGRCHAGQLAAYPFPGNRAAGCLTAGLGLVGLGWLWSHRRRRFAAILVLTFALGLVAAALRKYPYGPIRLSQHVAPHVCLLAGLGAAALLRRVRNERARWAMLLAVTAGMGVYGLRGIALDFARPFRDEPTREVRSVVRGLLRQADGDPVLVFPSPPRAHPVLRWYVGQHGPRIAWGESADWDALARRHCSAWVLSYSHECGEGPTLEAVLGQAGRGWRCDGEKEILLTTLGPKGPRHRCRIFHLARGSSEVAARVTARPRPTAARGDSAGSPRTATPPDARP